MTHQNPTPFFSVVTPSYNMLGYLKRSCASVADQEGPTFEHIVVDAVSDDGTGDWLKSNKRITSIIEKDNGMYDAVNKGWSHARGEVLSYLNCDEQYLPETLQNVWDYFQAHPDVDVLFGDALLIRPDGSLIAYRKGYQPRWCYILSAHLYVLSCTMFLRRRILDEGFRFDDHLKDIGDHDLVAKILRVGYVVRRMRRYLAAFTMTGSNMSNGENARMERARALEMAPAWVRWLRWPLNLSRFVEKAMSGAYYQRAPLAYAVYDSFDSSKRTNFQSSDFTFRWVSD